MILIAQDVIKQYQLGTLNLRITNSDVLIHLNACAILCTIALISVRR